MKKISIVGALLVMLLSIGYNVSAYSGWLDDYSGWCGTAGLYSQDTFYNDDGYFCMDNDISELSGTFHVDACLSTWKGYVAKDTASRDYCGNSTINMWCEAGKYKLRFYATGQSYSKATFSGSVYDEK